MKASTEDIVAAYLLEQSLKKVAKMFGMCPQSVHARLRKAGVDTRQSGLWESWQMDLIRDHYNKECHKNKLNLQGLADLLGKHKSQVCNLARKMGLTDIKRKYHARKNDPKFTTKEELFAHLSCVRKAWFANNPHPRGAAGMKHTDEAKRKISQKSQLRWDVMTKQQREDQTEKQVKARVAKNSPPRQRVETTWKAGWRDIGNQRIYARSRWEANIARMLEFRRTSGDLISWEHEPVTFWFEKIRRGVRSYKPDFRVTESGREPYFIEVKGWMDSRSRTTLKRMAKYHPLVKLDLIDGKRYAVIKRQLQSIIPEWESDSRKR
jgi:hypothetical protein